MPRNPVPRNPVPRNPVPRNNTPGIRRPVYTEIYGVKDYSVAVSADDANPGDVGAYLALFNVDKAYQDSYVFQVFITKPTYAFEVVEGCEPQNRTLGTMIANISDPANPVPRNPVPEEPRPEESRPEEPGPVGCPRAELHLHPRVERGGDVGCPAHGRRHLGRRWWLRRERERPDRRMHQGGAPRSEPGDRHAAGLSGRARSPPGSSIRTARDRADRPRRRACSWPTAPAPSRPRTASSSRMGRISPLLPRQRRCRPRRSAEAARWSSRRRPSR